MDFVFDRTAEGRVIKNLTVVDDATHEAVAIVPVRAIDAHSRSRCIASRLAEGDSDRQRQGVLRTGDVDLGPSARCKAVSD